MVQWWLSPDGATDWTMALEYEDRQFPYEYADFNFEQPFIRARYKLTSGGAWSEWSEVQEWTP